ncbi:Protein kinase [Phytophthora cinnamomi]|uniref:Protein kinase n=1 Tax=Phytophthora cinnamomi TaxID=4785 RepID=UPI00355960A6|nr:Protein kinase [Phytophthora cinnamomi]
MAEDASSRREACARCRRPPRVCYCASLPAQPLAAELTHVLVLQHKHEKRRRAAISSVPVLAQTLESVTLVTVGDDCDCGPGVDAWLDALLYDEGGDGSFAAAMILFPDEHARPLRSGGEAGEGGIHVVDAAQRVLLVVIDGTWKEAKKIARRNREHWEKAGRDWEARGARLHYICLDSEDGAAAASAAPPKGSIYGDLRREPMEGCMSTLEAVASALVVLEPGDSGRHVHDALLRAFKGMVSIQEQYQQRGRAAKLEQYGGVSKQEAVEAKRLELQAVQQKKSATTDKDKDVDVSTLVQREYVFYTSHTDFRHRQQLTQQGETVTCTYDEARERCVELNRDRKRGQRLAMLPLEAFRQCHDA